MGIVEDLLTHPGLYLGLDHSPDVIGHGHADSVALLRQTDPGVFELGPESSPFPMKVVVSMPEPGRIRYAWWYGRPGQEAVERSVGDLVLTS